jgi:hypothetical protein
MKNIIFTKSQKKLFTEFDVPTINMKKLEKRDSKFKDSNFSEKEYFELFQSYATAKSKSKDNKMYRRLLENFDENLKMIFEKIELQKE